MTLVTSQFRNFLLSLFGIMAYSLVSYTQYVSWTMPSADVIQMPTLVSRFHVVVWALHHIGHDSVSGSAMDILCGTHFDGFITCAF